jgi:hypothetical protein
MGIVRKDATTREKILGLVGLIVLLTWLGWQVSTLL